MTSLHDKIDIIASRCVKDGPASKAMVKAAIAEALEATTAPEAMLASALVAQEDPPLTKMYKVAEYSEDVTSTTIVLAPGQAAYIGPLDQRHLAPEAPATAATYQPSPLIDQPAGAIYQPGATTASASTLTPEQVEKYIDAADGDLGPECEDDWVETCRQVLRATTASASKACPSCADVGWPDGKGGLMACPTCDRTPTPDAVERERAATTASAFLSVEEAYAQSSHRHYMDLGNFKGLCAARGWKWKRAATTASASGEKPFAGPGEWFSIDVLGNPMREYAPGKWESCEWPSSRAPAPSREAAPLDGLPTYDPDRDNPGLMESRDKYNDGDYYKVEDVRAAMSAATEKEPK